MMSGAGLSYMPTPGLSYDPGEALYWDPSALQQEITRVFEVCNGCRMCFKYCDSFPSLFSFLDDEHDGDVTQLTEPQVEEVMDACFQCKLCEVQCPYTPRDSHEFLLDFPKLVHRYKAIQARSSGLSLRDRVLGDPDRLGQIARASFGMANLMNRVSLHRWFMEKLLGIHRDKDLPDFAPVPFNQWAANASRVDDRPGSEAVLFPTCFVQNNAPQLGRDTLEVFDRNQIECRCVGDLPCCGMPSWEHGDLETVQKNATEILDRLSPHVASGAKVVAINPSCSMMLRREYPKLVKAEDRERARALSEAVVDPSEYLWSIRKEDRFNTKFESSPKGMLAYHVPCHLRAQAKGFRGRDLMRKLPDVDRVTATLECCGHDGTYAMKVEGFEASQRIGRKSFDEMEASEAGLWVTDCPLASLQFEQHCGRIALHPMTVLARAYRGDSFTEFQPDSTAPIPPSADEEPPR